VVLGARQMGKNHELGLPELTPSATRRVEGAEPIGIVVIDIYHPMSLSANGGVKLS
jgi:hypothetical protein